MGVPSKEQLLVDRLRWIYDQRVIDLDLAKEVCGKLQEIIHYLDELVSIKSIQSQQ